MSLLGEGGMGEVYRATDLTLAQPVALKFLAQHTAVNDRLLERFHSEVRIARQVSHPNVCRVYDIGEAEGMPFISMEYVDGEDLGSLLQRIGRLPGDKALQIARKLCAGIAAAHDKGIIHRDLKPQNIMLNRRGEVVIMDFGLAAIAEELRGPEARSGTPAYMAPEQLRGDAVTAKSDIYALGLIIYELFTGKRAFEAQTMAEIMRAQEFESPVSITSLAADADPQVEKAVLRCLRPNPAERPNTALSVAAALPGGDPLAAALAAGETPSPELVAASGKKEAVAAKYALFCTALCVLGVIALPFVTQGSRLFSVAPLPYPPAVLEEKAREMAASFGHSPHRGDDVSWLSTDDGLVDKITKLPTSGPNTWLQLFEAENPHRFTYRQSPGFLIAPPDGKVSWDRPPTNRPGMLLLNLSGTGRLRDLEAVASVKQAALEPPMDEGVLFRAAGFEITNFREVEAVSLPKVPFDSGKAWKGPHPGLPGVEITVQTAMWRGRPVAFSILWPWSTPPEEPEPPKSARDLGFETFRFLLLGGGLVLAVVFARRNLRAQRADGHGATRLVAFYGFLEISSVLLTIHFLPSFGMSGLIFEQVSLVLAQCAILWLLYVAIEPAIRRSWPHTLITWNRVVAGNWLDPTVAWQVLIGVLVGLATRYAFLLRDQMNVSVSYSNVYLLSGTNEFFATWAQLLQNAIFTSFAIFFLMCAVKFVVRWDWIAVVAASLLVALQESGVRKSNNLAFDVILFVLIIAAFAFLLLRWGVVPSIIGILMINSTSIDFGPTYTSWVNSVAVAQMLILIALPVFAGWASQRQRAAPA
jgi:serine/threonine-protein kinase